MMFIVGATIIVFAIAIGIATYSICVWLHDEF